ncbi:UDP-galactopyranose mutase [Cellvibrio zantedeschiae]|uniref:UDP-galactopyranose mutase n=1 Tax=Cellvibrio zantedeschiae TaxID=1237077 RepID=A0ABQ3ANI9_9GAMM|nr:UDP-galactopyranose mutase [Cellvibrio zantedeschiae]GGY62913.1 UDP-galactopyranose mutase [Cellvibrio zantedeschiae]
MSIQIKTTDILIVGSGFSGCVIARELAASGHNVIIIDKRNHIGGNAYDSYDQNGLLIHNYGPHIFHTNSERIFKYLSNFTEWRPYEHRVLSVVNGEQYPFPINRDTLNQLYNLNLNEIEAAKYLERVREPREKIRTSEDVVLNSVGIDLYEKFFLNYTKKQWGVDPSQLKAGVAARIPVRTNTDDRYFTDEYQAMPLRGYSKMFESMLSHPNIELKIGVSFSDVKSTYSDHHVVYTGPIDEYFNYCFGKLPYRSLRFEHEHFTNTDKLQSVGTINYPNDYEYTRITEFKHLTGQQHSGSSTVKEYPQSDGDPYYPIPNDANEAIFKRYETLAKNENNVTFVGRLAQYRYYNMDQVVGAALSASEKLIDRFKN